MNYVSTRSISTNEIKVSSTKALINGIATDGGLYMPTTFPTMDLNSLKDLSYTDLCEEILSKYFDFNLKDLIENAYKTFDTHEVCPLKTFINISFIELFHGETLAFKDVALSLLPYLISTSLKIEKINKKIIILTATSGDTGSAAINGFKNNENIKICVLYPHVGVSKVQRLQMTTVNAPNVKVISIKGNFDDAQRTVKAIFADKNKVNKTLEKGYVLSSANSINIGRLLPQVVYYFSSYFNLIKKNQIKFGDKINVVVPTGNFGNIMASYIAREMGLPIEHFICASNENNILTDFFNTGVYDTNRKFNITSSPSMDILVSSNLERLIYLKVGAKKNIEVMKNLKETGKFTVDKNLFGEFFADYATEEETINEINNIYNKHNYIIDPHTAVAVCVYNKFLNKTNSNNHVIIGATASPFKFSKTVNNALGLESCDDDFKNIDILCNETSAEMPAIINEIKNSDEIFKEVLDINHIWESIYKFL